MGVWVAEVTDGGIGCGGVGGSWRVLCHCLPVFHFRKQRPRTFEFRVILVFRHNKVCVLQSRNSNYCGHDKVFQVLFAPFLLFISLNSPQETLRSSFHYLRVWLRFWSLVYLVSLSLSCKFIYTGAVPV